MKFLRLFVVLVVSCNGQLRFDDNVLPISSAGAPNIPADAATTVTAEAGAPDAKAATGCTGDDQCPLPSLHCDSLSGACVECTSDAHCLSGVTRRCDAALHRCVECGISADCGEGQRCEPATRRCVRTCERLDQCALEAPLCDFADGFCRRCHTDVECLLPPGQEHCDEANGKCAACVEDQHCPSETPYCDRTRGTCAACLSSAHCPEAQSNCDPTTRSCVVVTTANAP